MRVSSFKPIFLMSLRNVSLTNHGDSEGTERGRGEKESRFSDSSELILVRDVKKRLY